VARRELGRVDVLVNNAALEYQRRFHALTPVEIEALIRVDLLAPIQLTRLLLPQMLADGYGRIVNVSSIAGRVGFPLTEAYACRPRTPRTHGVAGFPHRDPARRGSRRPLRRARRPCRRS
jgi:hypothetical protein